MLFAFFASSSSPRRIESQKKLTAMQAKATQ
jgi:hypothetical protein